MYISHVTLLIFIIKKKLNKKSFILRLTKKTKNKKINPLDEISNSKN